MDLSTYRQLHAKAQRLARSVPDAEDLVHDTLLAALIAGRDDPAWLSGVLRNQAALAARTAVRRRRREQTHAPEPTEPVAMPSDRPSPASLLQRLPPAPRRLAVLLLHGLDATEIRWILAIPDTAFRQRLTRIRKELAALPAHLREDLRDLATPADRSQALDQQTGLLRRALKAALVAGPGLGTHDPDGHLLVVHRGAHTRAPGGN